MPDGSECLHQRPNSPLANCAGTPNGFTALRRAPLVGSVVAVDVVAVAFRFPVKEGFGPVDCLGPADWLLEF